MWSLRTCRPLQVLLFVIVIVITAFIIPALTPTNLHSLSGEEKVFAEYAIEEASHGWNPIESMLARKYRVLWVKELKPTDEGVYKKNDLVHCASIIFGGNEFGTAFSKPYQARVQELSFFGIPMSQFQILCTGSSWRVGW